MKKLLFMVLAVALVGCAYKHRPIYNVDDPIPRAAQTLSLDRIENLIVAAGMSRGWQFQRIAPGHMTAIQNQQKFSATVDITFDQQHYRIDYQSSTGLLASDGTIHSHYNLWVRNFEHDINTQLANVVANSR